MSSSFRKTVEEASLPALKRLDALPRAVPVLSVLVLLIAGALIPGWGWVLTGVVALFLAWMLLFSWPRLTGTERIMRVAVLAFIVAIALVQAIPQS